MQLPEYLTIEAEYALLCPRGNATLEDTVARISSAIEFCREQKIRKMLIDITDLTGLRVPTVIDRFWAARDWAESARGAVMIAIIARPELIDARRFGITAAQNLGLRVEHFESRQLALDWLLAERRE
jgi:hypothetical protein